MSSVNTVDSTMKKKTQFVMNVENNLEVKVAIMNTMGNTTEEDNQETETIAREIRV